MRMVGPNCLGVVNTDPDVRLNAIFGRPLAPRGRVAMSSQSGAMGLAIVDYASELGIGVSQFVSVGNKADVSGNDLLEWWEQDADTNVVVLYLESFGNPRRFAQIARRVARRKPILAVKSGRGNAGARAARSHTAALASSDVGADALFRQAGIIRLDTIEELFDVASLLTNQPLPAGNRVAIVTNAGGPAILCADACEANGLELPDLSASTVDVLRAVLPHTAGLSNPVDMIAAATAEQYEIVTQQLLLDPNVDALVAINISVGGARAEQFAASIRAGVESAHTALAEAKPVVACFMAGTPPRAFRASEQRPTGAGTIPAYRFPEAPARALGHAVRYRRWLDRPVGRHPRLAGTDAEAARAIVAGAQERDLEWLPPEDARALVAAAGIRTVRQELAADPAAAARVAADIGFPVVLKLVSPDVVHKSDVGGVVVGLESEVAVVEACERMLASVPARIDGFLVQEQARPGREVLVGVAADPTFGPLVGFGLGGTAVEALHDTVFRIAPLSDADAAEMVASIRGRSLLEAFRGRPAADTGAIAELLRRVSWLAETVHLEEMDLNPVVVYPDGEGLVAVDVRIALRAAGPG